MGWKTHQPSTLKPRLLIETLQSEPEDEGRNGLVCWFVYGCAWTFVCVSILCALFKLKEVITAGVSASNKLKNLEKTIQMLIISVFSINQEFF